MLLGSLGGFAWFILSGEPAKGSNTRASTAVLDRPNWGFLISDSNIKCNEHRQGNLGWAVFDQMIQVVHAHIGLPEHLTGRILFPFLSRLYYFGIACNSFL